MASKSYPGLASSEAQPPGREQRWQVAWRVGDDGAMFGPIAIVVVLVILLPVGVLMSGAVASALLGFVLNDDVDRSHEGSELLDTNV